MFLTMFFEFLRGQRQASPVFPIKKQSSVNYFHVEEECTAVAIQYPHVKVSGLYI
jgi:hypothetical protein